MSDDQQRLLERLERLTALGPKPPWWRFFKRRAWQREHDSIMAMDVSMYGTMLRSIYTAESAKALVEQPSALLTFTKLRIVKDGE